jgi:cell division septation protein DedD
VAQQIQDEGFREIQLNGKQLVFLFMAVTVVSVVIFLLGVLFGRGARAQFGGVADNAPIGTVAETSPTRPATPAPALAAGSDPTTVAPPPTADELSYFNRLEKQTAPAEQLKPAPDRSAAPSERPAASAAAALRTPPPAVSAPAQEPAPSAAPPASAAPASAEPAGQGFAVQIAALNVRSEADAIARRLSSKGYAAYVLAPANGTPSVFRVRVGKFNTRREAETVAAQLQKEEQLKPWVTR